MKAGAVVRRFTHNDTLLESTRQGVNWSFEYHGAASGVILGDERIDGLSPMTGYVQIEELDRHVYEQPNG